MVSRMAPRGQSTKICLFFICGVCISSSFMISCDFNIWCPRICRWFILETWHTINVCSLGKPSKRIHNYSACMRITSSELQGWVWKMLIVLVIDTRYCAENWRLNRARKIRLNWVGVAVHSEVNQLVSMRFKGDGKCTKNRSLKLAN